VADAHFLEAEAQKSAADAHSAGRPRLRRRLVERLLDLALRGGPYGDQFGRRPDGLTLAKVKAAAHGIDLGPLAPRVPEVLRTPSGKIELAPALFLEDLKHAEADLAAPAPDLVVIGRRDLRSNNSWMHNLPVLAKGPRRCTALVHPADAARCRVTDAGSARLIGASGHAITVEVKVSDEVMPGVISLPHGWGHDLPGTHLEVAARRPGANLNALLDENLRDPLSGNAVLSGVPVRLEPETS
jgi:anaerobic selenocysteine-containing dehydrogenase